MTLRKRTQFPFLKLPAELRNLIYVKSLDFEGVGRLLTEHYEAHVNDGTSIDWPELQTHPLLAVNKQISREARYILHRKTLRLPHSTTPNGLITDVVSKTILENVRKVDITRDESFGEVHTWCDFLEFFRLIKSAVNIWTDCHHLQELTIVMQGQQVMAHLDSCPAQGHCFFLDEIEKMMSSLEELRGIKKVTFGGFLEDYAVEAKKWMETPPAYILKKIPLQVRRQIYGYLVDLNDANSSLVKASNTAVAGWNPPKTMDAIAPSMVSPELLRVNKQITTEIITGMYSGNFTISAPPPHHVHTCTSVTKFIGLHNLQEIRHLTLDISSRGSLSVAADWRILIKELAVKLKTKRSLVSLHINVRDAGWVERQLKTDKRATSRPKPDSKDHDFYGLKALGELTTKRLSQTWLKRLTFGDGVHHDVRSHLRTQLCGSKMTRWNEAEEAHGLQGLVAED
ncbi:Coiled-coil domain-containing protein mtmr15 [Neofusicoccum parvum]|uniref:F-box domain-containing protein n=2 Tax=Neofusicoccum parvum TaxID=310453 RepID=R1GEU4_BOTPV|nr:hypothetical protein UCRNP2_6470 [Neofusicoccum parvum UCRNP2]GME32518.1 Coiled-coil domain-containing protein mtmr15 [Neofusicoccum parvum]GME57668.1 Coiled-coil domain-containing protein mtmr15 [Neofusicoccum parvum]